jgi:Glutaredoxin-like domain (DUF836)
MSAQQASRLTVLHRAGCALCDEMLQELESLRARTPLPPVELVDVDADARLARRHGQDVPVLLWDDTVVCRHRLDVSELLRLLRRSSG